MLQHQYQLYLYFLLLNAFLSSSLLKFYSFNFVFLTFCFLITPWLHQLNFVTSFSINFLCDFLKLFQKFILYLLNICLIILLHTSKFLRYFRKVFLLYLTFIINFFYKYKIFYFFLVYFFIVISLHFFIQIFFYLNSHFILNYFLR